MRTDATLAGRFASGAEDDMEVEDGEAAAAAAAGPPPPPPPPPGDAPPPPPPPPPDAPEAGPAAPPSGYSAADALAAYGGDAAGPAGMSYEAFAQESIAYQARPAAPVLLAQGRLRCICRARGGQASRHTSVQS